jgi:hypothetical protein
MTPHRKIAGLCAATALSLALAVSTALAAPAGDEYLPKVPQSGADHSGGSSADHSGGSSGPADTPTTTLPSAGTGSESTSGGNQPGSGGSRETGQQKRKKDNSEQITPVDSSGSGSSGDGGSSGSILFNPIVLLMIGAVIAAAVGMTLWRRQAEEGEGDSREGAGAGTKAGGRRQAGPRTPDGEIVTGPDKIA